MCVVAAAVAIAVATAPMCLRADRGVSPDVMAALVGGGASPSPKVDPAFEAAIRAIRAPVPSRRSHRR